MRTRSYLAVSLVGLAATSGFAVLGGTALSQGADPAAADRDSSRRVPGSETLHRAVKLEGAEWRFESFRTPSGDRCTSQTVPGEGAGISCYDRAALLRSRGEPVVAFPGARQLSSPSKRLTWDNLWVNGFVAPTVKVLEVLNVDCSVAQVPIDSEGAFMHVVTKADIARDVVPYRLLARNRRGLVVFDQVIRLGLPPNGEASGLEAPKPSTDCRSQPTRS